MLLRFILYPLILIGSLYIIIGLILYASQSTLLYFPNQPDRKLTTSPADIGLKYESVTISTTDKVELHGWLIPSDQERGIILFFHGNAGNISHRLDSIRIFNRLNFSTLIIDYRGYGRSTGKPSEQGTYLDAEASWQFLVTKRQYDPKNIILFGRSLGGAIAAYLASQRNAGALILESTFTSIPDLAKDFYPWLPVRWLSKFRYASLELIPAASCPKLIIHSKDDEIIPFKHGEKLFLAATENKHFLQINGGHNDGFITSGQIYQQGLKNFTYLYFKSVSKLKFPKTYPKKPPQ